MRILFGGYYSYYFFFLALQSRPATVELFISVYIILNFCQFKGLLLW